MLTEKKKEMLEFAKTGITDFIEALSNSDEKEKANDNGRVKFALEFSFKFDEGGTCIGLEKTSSTEYRKKCAYNKEGCIHPGDNLDAYVYMERIRYLKSNGIDIKNIREEDICNLCPSKPYCENGFDPKCMYFSFVQDDADE